MGECPGCDGKGVQKRTTDGIKIECPVCKGAGKWGNGNPEKTPEKPPEKSPEDKPAKNPNDPDQIEKRVKKSLGQKISEWLGD